MVGTHIAKMIMAIFKYMKKNNDQNLEHYIIGKPASTFKSGYIWKWNDFLYAENKGTPRVYSFELGGAFSELNNARSLINSRTNVDCGAYMYNGYRYTYWESKSLDVGSVVTACDSKNNCSASVMSPKTWIYAFGGQGGELSPQLIMGAFLFMIKKVILGAKHLL